MTDNEYKKIFSKNLNYYMDLRHKTQTDIINDLDINKSAISSWCNGTRLPRMNKVEVLCQYLNINVSNLLEENCENNSYFEFISEDDAMYPLLDVGDIAVVHKQDTMDETSSNNVGTYLIKLNNQETIRRFLESQDKTYYTLVAMNVACKSIDIKKSDLLGTITILGKVVEAKNRSAFK